VRSRRWLSAGVVLPVAIGAFVIGMWLWVFLYHLSGDWQEEQPGLLGDTTFPVAAEPVCQVAMAAFGETAPAWATDTPGARADVVDESVLIFAAMLEQLRRLPTGAESDAVAEWLSDWDTYIADRTDYALRLRSDPEARFYVTQSDRDRRQITLAIDRFAKTNDMPSCVTPADLS